MCSFPANQGSAVRKHVDKGNLRNRRNGFGAVHMSLDTKQTSLARKGGQPESVLSVFELVVVWSLQVQRSLLHYSDTNTYIDGTHGECIFGITCDMDWITHTGEVSRRWWRVGGKKGNRRITAA